MSREVSYSEWTIQARNPIARFAHRARYRLSLDRVATDVADGGTVLDFGCGEGTFLNTLAERRPDLKLFGFDPESNHVADKYTHVDDMGKVADASVDLICTFETLEHLFDNEIDDFVASAKRVLAPGGRVLISVPIIGGPPLLAKEANRVMVSRHRSDYRAGELMRTAFTGRPAERLHPRESHKGFDFRVVLARLGRDFDPVSRGYSPFAKLPWWLNSQVFAEFSVRA